MPASFIQIPTDSTGKKLRTFERVVGADTVHEEFITLIDAAGNQLAIINIAPSTEYGLVTRNIPSGTQAISAASLPLPAGAATEATLANKANEGAPITGQALEAGGSSVLGWFSSMRKAITDRLPAALVGGRLDVNLGASGITLGVNPTGETAGVGIGAAADAEATGNGSVIAVLKRLRTLLAGTLTVDTELTTADLDTGVGVDTRAVVGLARAESGGAVLVGSANPLPISVASLPLPAGASTEATLATRLTESDFDTKTGILTEAAPATDTASSGLNGRLQRIAQRLTSLIALLPAALVGGRLDVNLGAAPVTVTVDSELPAAAALADAAANPTTPTIGAAALGFNGTTWDRIRALTANADAQSAGFIGQVATALGYVFNGTTWDRARGDIANGLDVDVTRQPARSRTVDAISTADQTDALMAGLTALTPKFARINGALSGSNTLVAGVATKKIRVLAISFVAAGAVTVNFQTAAAGALLAGPYTLAANGGVVLPYCPLGHFETVAGDLLGMNLSAAITVGGHLVYVEI